MLDELQAVVAVAPAERGIEAGEEVDAEPERHRGRDEGDDPRRAVVDAPDEEEQNDRQEPEHREERDEAQEMVLQEVAGAA